MTTPFDAIVIGSGQAGPPLAVRLAAAGMKTALIEREHHGGTCVNDGCIPTKTLMASARAAFMARHGADYGVSVAGAVGVDMKAVKARKDRVVAESIENLTKWLVGTPNLSLIRGQARFVGANAVEVAGHVLEAPKVFINVGGRATLPDWPGVDAVARSRDNPGKLTEPVGGLLVPSAQPRCGRGPDGRARGGGKPVLSGAARGGAAGAMGKEGRAADAPASRGV